MNERIIKVAHIVAVGIILLVGLVVVALRVQSASGQTQNSNSSGGQQNGNMSGSGGQSSTLGSADRKFAMDAAMDGMTEVQLGRIATQQGMSDGVKQFGQRMVDDHTKANNDLMQWASTNGMTLPTTLDAKHQAMVNKMSKLNGAAFDKEYSKGMVSDHNKAVAMFQKEANSGKDSGLKSFASSTLPTLQEHLSMARGLSTGSSAMNGSMNGNTSGSMNGNASGSMNGNMGGNSNSGRSGNRNGNSNKSGNSNNSNRR
jgi:putative membrane protein